MEHPKSEGAIFLNDRKQAENHPDFRGHLKVTGAQIKRLVEMAKAGQEPKLQLALWKRVAQTGTRYMFVKSEAYMQEQRPPADDGWGDEGGWVEESPEAQTGVDDLSDDDIPF